MVPSQTGAKHSAGGYDAPTYLVESLQIEALTSREAHAGSAQRQRSRPRTVFLVVLGVACASMVLIPPAVLGGAARIVGKSLRRSAVDGSRVGDQSEHRLKAAAANDPMVRFQPLSLLPRTPGLHRPAVTAVPPSVLRSRMPSMMGVVAARGEKRTTDWHTSMQLPWRYIALDEGAAKRPKLAAAYILVKDSVDVHLDAVNDPYRVQKVKPDADTMRRCSEVMRSSTPGAWSDDEVQALHMVSELPVAVEMPPIAHGKRTFILPGNITVRLRERSYTDAGLGGSLWGSGIGLAILLSQGVRRLQPGVRVLELGSGVGLTGMTCALGGAVATLSDWGEAGEDHDAAIGAPLNPKASLLASSANETKRNDIGPSDVPEYDSQPKALLANLGYNVNLNGLEGRTSVRHLDWYSSLAPSFVPDQTFEVVIGADLIYYQRDIAALASTIVSHTSASGVAYLMCHRGRTGLVELVELLRAHGEVEEELYTVVPLINTDSGQGDWQGVKMEQGDSLTLLTFRRFAERKT